MSAWGRPLPSLLAETARRFRQQTDRDILGLFGGNLLEIGQHFYRNDNFFLLLAGDHPAVRDSLMEVFASEGYFVAPVEYGPQALEYAAKLSVDLVLLDLNMPIKNG